MRYLAEMEDGNIFKMNATKIKRAIGLKLMSQKEDGFILGEFVSVLKSAFEMVIPDCLIDSSSFDAKKNLFEHYEEFDLSFLIGHVIIIPYAHQRVLERTTL